MKKIVACIFIILTISTVFIVRTYSKEESLETFIFESKVLNSEMLSKKLVRFHVIANSDTDVDQNVKLKVKDAVLEYMIPKLNVSRSKEETIQIIESNADHIKQIAENTLRKNSMSNDVSVVLNTTFFPTKYYNDFSLPAGDYLALRVIIGNGEGKNWWCVLFPPLCLVDVRKDESIESNKELEQENGKDSLLELDDPLREEIEEIYKENSIEQERPQIRWKALELLGLYKDSQDQ